MIVLDLESVKEASDERYVNWKLAGIKAPVNYKDPVKIEESIKEQQATALNSFALSPLTGKIILIGMLVDCLHTGATESDYTKYRVADADMYYVGLDNTNEKELLTEFWKIFSYHNLNTPLLITFNGKKFDLPYILHRSAILGIDPPRKIRMQPYLSKYDNTMHFDVYNWFDGGSLVEWSYKLGLTESLARDGNKIGGWYEEGNMDLIKDKNKIDLAQTYSIYSKLKDWL